MLRLYTTNHPESRRKFIAFLDDLDRMNQGQQVDYINNTKKNKPVRSADQNARYWVIITAICNVTGDLKEDCHDDYKEMFNGGESTTDLDTDDFSIYSKEVELHAKSFHGVTIKDPKERDYELWSQLVKEDYRKMIRSI